MISEKEVEHIAKLARLELTKDEIKKMQKDLSEILDYFDLLKKAPLTAKILQEQNLGGQARHFSKDKPRHSQLSDEIVGAAPDKEGEYVRVKTIL